MELLGYRIKDGKVVAVVNYPNARRFTLVPRVSSKTGSAPLLREKDKGEK